MAHKHEMVSGHIIPIVIDIIEWIEDNIFTALPVTAISRKSGYSHWYFQRQFALITGYTLGTYVSRRKMTIAAGILKQTQDSALSISLLLGFEGQATFRRTFRRHFGMSPTSYRRHPAQLEERMQYPLNLEEEGNVQKSGLPAQRQTWGLCLLTNGFWRHYAARADVVANPIIFAQGGYLNITAGTRRLDKLTVSNVNAYKRAGRCRVRGCGRRPDRRFAVHRGQPGGHRAGGTFR